MANGKQNIKQDEGKVRYKVPDYIIVTRRKLHYYFVFALSLPHCSSYNAMNAKPIFNGRFEIFNAHQHTAAGLSDANALYYLSIKSANTKIILPFHHGNYGEKNTVNRQNRLLFLLSGSSWA